VRHAATEIAQGEGRRVQGDEEHQLLGAVSSPALCPYCRKEIAVGREILGACGHLVYATGYAVEDDGVREDFGRWHHPTFPGGPAALRLDDYVTDLVLRNRLPAVLGVAEISYARRVVLGPDGRVALDANARLLFA
jgi:hypothetical protein